MFLGEIPPISVNTTFGLFDSEGLLFLGFRVSSFFIFFLFFRRAPAAIRVCVS